MLSLLPDGTLTLMRRPMGSRLPALAVAWCCVMAALPVWASDPERPRVRQLDPAYFVGAWIWDNHTADRQTRRFWKHFEVPREAQVSKARLRMTADNSYRVFLDGREFGQGSELRSLTEYDLSLVLAPGPHVLAVEAYNEYLEAGVLAGLVIELTDGRVLELPTDASWFVAPETDRGWATRKRPGKTWHAATVIAPFRGAPWINKPSRILYPAPLRPANVYFWQSGWFQISLTAVCGLSLLVCLRLLGRLAVQSQAQQMLQRERARIARDIHDELGAGLTQLVLYGEVARTERSSNAEAQARFQEVSDQGRRILRSLDEVVWMVNSQRDTLEDFETYLCRHAETFFRSTPIRCRWESDPEIPETAFGLAARRNLFLAVKEALNNVARHSGATEVLLQLRVREAEVVITVRDDGKGFAPDTVGNAGNGLLNMAQRAAEVGGSCRITSRPGEGCLVELTVPLTESAAERPWWRRRKSRLETGGRATSKESGRWPGWLRCLPR